MVYEKSSNKNKRQTYKEHDIGNIKIKKKIVYINSRDKKSFR